MTPRTRTAPGKVEFETERLAIEFAEDRVAEHWIVHCYQHGDKWVVQWWCQ